MVNRQTENQLAEHRDNQGLQLPDFLEQMNGDGNGHHGDYADKPAPPGRLSEHLTGWQDGNTCQQRYQQQCQCGDRERNQRRDIGGPNDPAQPGVRRRLEGHQQAHRQCYDEEKHVVSLFFSGMSC